MNDSLEIKDFLKLIFILSSINSHHNIRIGNNYFEWSKPKSLPYIALVSFFDFCFRPFNYSFLVFIQNGNEFQSRLLYNSNQCSHGNRLTGTFHTPCSFRRKWSEIPVSNPIHTHRKDKQMCRSAFGIPCTVPDSATEDGKSRRICNEP
jgi:hypothetical protein